MDRAFAASYRRLQENHWWFYGRSRVLSRLLATLPWPAVPRTLEVGVGPGHDLGAVYPSDVRLVGLEADRDLARLAAAISGIEVHRGTLDTLPEALRGATFDAVAMFDVLEHIKDDRDALCRVYQLLAPNGIILLSTPAYQWMWGRQDVVNRHFRRYSRRGLLRLLAETGFEPLRATYFNSLLFAPIALFRLASLAASHLGVAHRHGDRSRSDFDVTLGPLDRALGRVFAFEARLVTKVSLPFGVSLFVAARRSRAPVVP